MCRKAWLCDFKVIGDHQDAQVEVCVQCSKRVIYNKNKINGRIDNYKYLQDHRRDFVQPYGETRKDFLKLYGHNMETYKQIAKAQQAKQAKGQEYEEMMKDVKSFVKRRMI